MRLPLIWLPAALVATIWCGTASLGFAQAKPADAAPHLAALEAIGPSIPEGYRTFDAAPFREAAAKIVASTAADAQPAPIETPAELLARVTRVEAQKTRVDRLLALAFAQRSAVAAFDFGADRDEALSHYLQRTLLLTELAGRVNEHAATLARISVAKSAGQPATRGPLLDFYDKSNSPYGVLALATLLVDPEETDPARKSLTPAEKLKIIELIRRTGRREAIPMLAEMLNVAEDSAAVLIRAVEVLQEIGVPQDARPNQDENTDAPPITAAEIIELLNYLPNQELGSALTLRKQALLTTYQALAAKGLPKAVYQLGPFDVRPGDWILTYNPSPYNLFTNLSPGLFTHVGVIAEEIGSDGKRRIVIVEVLEDDNKVAATNIDAYIVGVTRYAILRCNDPVAAVRMGQVATSIIGNPAEFDLTFQSKNVEKYRGKPLKGQKIKAYCAGVPLLCSQETGLPREQFFPIEEHPVGGHLAENLERLGMAIGEQMVTPTSPLFSSHMQLVGMKQPFYDPAQDIEEQVFNHFAQALIDQELTPNQDLYQALRLRVAKASQGNPLLAQALAAAAGVHVDTDLVAGAKAQAVIETLDEIATAQSTACRNYLGALLPGTPQELARLGRTPEEIKAITDLRNQVPELWAAVSTGRMTRLALRNHLVQFYAKSGMKAVDARFFPAPAAAIKTPATAP